MVFAMMISNKLEVLNLSQRLSILRLHKVRRNLFSVYINLIDSTFFILAHLSRRLKGELIVYQSSCRICVCVSVCL